MTLPQTEMDRRERRLALTWGVFYLFLWLYRSAASIAGQLLVRRITSLGDAGRYQSGELFISWSVLTDLTSLQDQRRVGTSLTHSVGTMFNQLFQGDPFLINIGFQTVAFIGIVVLLQTAKPEHRARLAFLFLLPSFTLWSSVASKDALAVFFVCLASAYILKIWYGEDRLNLLHVAAFVFAYLTKPQYGAALGYLLGVSWAARYVRQPAAFALGLGVASLSVLYIFKDTMVRVVFDQMLPAFSGRGATFVRPDFWETPEDIFLKAPEGMFLSLFGPTFEEALFGHVFHAVAFVESAVILSTMIYFAIQGLMRMPAFTFIVGAFTTFWLLFANYPFGDRKSVV